MPATALPHVEEYAPPGASFVRTSFLAARCADGTWQVDQVTTWIDRNGENDGDCWDVEYGLTEAEAREIAARLSGEALKAAA